MKVIGEFTENDKGTWDLTLTTQKAKSHAQSVSCPRSRTAAVNKFLALVWAMKPGTRFTLTLSANDTEQKPEQRKETK